MIPYPSMNNTYIPSSNAAPAGGPAQPVPHAGKSALERWSRNMVIDLTGNEDDEPVEPPAKKLKLESGDHVTDPVRVTNPVDDQPAGIASNLANAFPMLGYGRPPWSFGDGIPNSGAEGGISVRSLEGSQQHPSASLPPFPIRPWTYGQPQNAPGGGFGPDDASMNKVQTAPYTLEAPKSAPIFDSNKAADFYPWRGTHPEDVLNEQTSKHGYFDHVQVSQNESNTARPSLYAQFKHRSGLKLLSSVFTMALEKRQAQSRVAEASTFKPPPRVTLTDMKREAWLRDLANASVPLRRLSRTIPHGIRGKGLLDQCLGKNIPIGRALWLAKCVGANEIRAFKRKGTTPAVASGLESKWVRDWTVNVVQFLEGVIGGCGVDGWKANLGYAARLSSRLFLENLLDQEHFLEWFLSSLEGASLEVLPVWLAMMSTYWKNLVGYRKRGRRVAECLLERLRAVIASGGDGTLKPVCQRLSFSIKNFVLSNPSCFVLPKTWAKYNTTLASCLDLGNPEFKVFFGQLSNRNMQVCKTRGTSRDPSRFSTRRLIGLLDRAMTNYVPDLASECQNLELDHGTLISTVLLWASTTFRSGLSRVYVAVKLLRRLNKSGVDTDARILAFLVNRGQSRSVCFTNVYHIISELVRSQSFSISRYLQWLVARGAVSNAAAQKHVTRDIELLSHIPPRRLPSHVWNHRNILLGRTGYSVSAEGLLVDRIKGHLQYQLPRIFGADGMSIDAGTESGIDFSSLGWTVRSEISHYVREYVALDLREDLLNTDGDPSARKIAVPAITRDEFYAVRHVLEHIEDLSILAEVLKHASQSTDSNVLIVALDTVNHHFDSFSALGVASDLFKAYLASYTRIAAFNNATLELTTSLIEVGIKLPAELSTVAVLRRELARLDSKYALTASSPVSDHMSDTLDPVNPTFPGTLEQLLVSGNSIDEATMVRVFDLLLKTLTAISADAKLAPNDTAAYLARLRTFNAKFFDSLMLKWVVSTLASLPRPKLCVFLPPLIGVGCITFEAFFVLLQKLFDSKEREVPNAPELKLEVLRLLKICPSGDGAVLDMVSYRYKVAREGFISLHLDSIMRIINDTLSDNVQSLSQSDEHANSVSSCAISLISEVIVKSTRESDREPATSILCDFPNCKGELQQAVNRLLGAQAQSGVPAAQETLQMINDFSLPCCLVRFQLLCDTESDNATKEHILDMVFKAAVSDIHNGISRWIDVIGVLSPQSASQVRQRAVQALLSLALPDSQSQPNVQETTEPYATSEQSGLVYLLIIEELGWTIPENQNPSLGGLLIEKLHLVLQRVASGSKNQDDVGLVSPFEPGSTLVFWIYVLLRLVAIHRSAPLLDPTSKEDVSDQNRLLLLLCCIALCPAFTQHLDERCSILPPTTTPWNTLQQTPPSTWRGLRTYALDVAASLIDTLPDEARQQCARFIRERCAPIYHPQNNPYILFLFGPIAESPAQALVAMANTASPAPSPAYGNPGPLSQAQTQPASTPPPNISPIIVEDPYQAHKLQFQQGGRFVGPCPPRPWEMLEESAPILGVNDTALNLAYFGTRQVRG